MDLLNFLLAQATQPVPPAGPAPGGTDAFLRLWLPIILVAVAFWWFSSRTQRRERDKYQQMLNSLKRNDRVQTIGGILGTVVDVRDNEVTIKIDEAANVKLRVVRGAIKEIHRDATAEPPKA